LYSWKAEVEKRSPGSVIIIEHHLVREKHHFKRMFVAFKASVDGFHKGCRPYLSIDSTFLTRRFRGQLATACAVDGHNWLFPVVFAIMECEDSDNWEWFMEKLHDCIGDPLGLAICTDAGKGLSAVKTVFRNAEHRECMRHLVTNLRRSFAGRCLMRTCGQQPMHGSQSNLMSTCPR
jgi:zinc finger SWIM domain-containing protein 3